MPHDPNYYMTLMTGEFVAQIAILKAENERLTERVVQLEKDAAERADLAGKKK